MLNETYSLDQFEAGSEPTHTSGGVVALGQNIAQYAPLGQVTATGKFVIWNPAATNGSEKAVRIAAHAIDATAADTSAQLIKAGSFNTDLIAWPGGTTDAQKAVAFMGTPISHQTLAN